MHVAEAGRVEMCRHVIELGAVVNTADYLSALNYKKARDSELTPTRYSIWLDTIILPYMHIFVTHLIRLESLH